MCVPHPVCVMCCGNPQGCWESLSWEVCVLWDCVVGWSGQASGDPVGFCLPPLLGLECTADTAHVDCSHSPTNDAYLCNRPWCAWATYAPVWMCVSFSAFIELLLCSTGSLSSSLHTHYFTSTHHHTHTPCMLLLTRVYVRTCVLECGGQAVPLLEKPQASSSPKLSRSLVK